LDLGCGDGSLAGALSGAGYAVLGIDASAAMVRLARRRWPQARFRVGRLEALTPPRCVALLAVGEVLSYAFTGRAHRAALGRFLRRAYASLQPGGLLLFDVLETTPRPQRRESWREDPGGAWAALVRLRERGALVRREITSYRRLGRRYRRSHVVHVQRPLPRRALLGALRATGFRVRALRGYDGTPLRSGQAAFLAVKPAR
jgi:SAM-dependent methyltransferase